MSDELDALRTKIDAIFREMVGDRAAALDGRRPAAGAMDKFAEGIAIDYDERTAEDIAFHLADWNDDAAFLVAVHLFPERFTPEEINAGFGLLIIHAPDHLAAAAKLAGHPIQDIFGVGALEGNRS